MHYELLAGTLLPTNHYQILSALKVLTSIA